MFFSLLVFEDSFSVKMFDSLSPNTLEEVHHIIPLPSFAPHFAEESIIAKLLKTPALCFLFFQTQFS